AFRGVRFRGVSQVEQGALDAIEFSGQGSLRIAEDSVDLLRLTFPGGHNVVPNALEPRRIHGPNVVLNGKTRTQDHEPVEHKSKSFELAQFGAAATVALRYALEENLQSALAGYRVAPHNCGLFFNLLSIGMRGANLKQSLFSAQRVSELDRFWREMAPVPGRMDGSLRFALASALATLVLVIEQPAVGFIAPSLFMLFLVSHDTPF